MGDEGGFNPCECVWSHEMAMRRLLNMLRNSQAYCTDNECFADDVRSPTTQENPGQLLLMSILFLTMLFFYYSRPRRESTERLTKPINTNNDSSGNPPNPPPAIN